MLSAGTVVILAAGTGHPYFTTDTTAALRACEIGAAAVLKGTQVDGVYSADPRRVADAQRYSRIGFSEALSRQLRVMDLTAFSLCMDNQIPILVFRFGTAGALERLLRGDLSSATLVDDGPGYE
jgi:uridylate kinase